MIVLGGSTYTFAQEFPMRINIQLQLENYAQIERIAYLPRKLSNENAPRGFQPQAGDITYYAPWGNLAIFVENFRYSSGLLPLGKLEEHSLPLLQKPGPYSIRIEPAQQD